jgi:hypothetical protein
MVMDLPSEAALAEGKNYLFFALGDRKLLKKNRFACRSLRHPWRKEQSVSCARHGRDRNQEFCNWLGNLNQRVVV